MKSFASVLYELSVIEPDGRIARILPRKRNLILDSGLDMVADRAWPDCINVLHLGSGLDAVKRDSGAVLVSIAGNVATSTAAFFEAGDVGRLLKLDSGLEVKITGFSSAQSVQLAPCPDSAASEFTVWYVNRAALSSSVIIGSNQIDGGCGSAVDGALGLFSFWKTLQTPAFPAAATITEAGWSPDGGALFGMDLLAVPVGVMPGQFVRVKITLSVSVPFGIEAVANVGGDFNTAGTLANECGFMSDYGAPKVEPSGWTHGGDNWTFAPHRNHTFAVYRDPFELAPMAADNPRAPSYIGNDAGVNLAEMMPYTVGSFTREHRCTIPPSRANGTIYGLCFGSFVSLRFDVPQEKTDMQTIALVWNVSWGRVLVN